MATYFQQVLHNSPIITGVKILPMGITACLVGALSQPFPVLFQKPRYTIPLASALCFGSGILLAYSGGGHGKDYWRCEYLNILSWVPSPDSQISSRARLWAPLAP